MNSETFIDHLEALRKTLLRSLLAVGVALIPGFYFSPELLQGMIRYGCPPELKLNFFSPMEPFIAQLNVGLALAFLIASPVILWQVGAFIAPALYQHEKRKLRLWLTVAVILLLAGVAMGFFLAVPLVMKFALSFATEELNPVIGLGRFLHLSIMISIGFAIAFEIPMLLLVLVSAGVIQFQTLQKLRTFVVVGIFISSAILTPPDVLSQLLMAIPTWILFEIALLVAKKIRPRNERE